MSLTYKLGRIARLRHLLGLRGAIALEAAWTLRRPLVHLQVPGYRNPFVLRRNGSDLSVFEQVFVEEDCAVPFMAAMPRTIVDGGANVGFTTAWFAERYPQATVIAVEPSGANCELLRQNTRRYPNVRVLQTGLWSRSTSLRVKNPDALPWSFQVEECAAGAPGSFTAVSIPDLLAQTSGTIDLLKLDIEGAERVLFAGDVDAWIGRVGTLVIEIHGPEADAVVRGSMRLRSFKETTRGEKVIFQRAVVPATSGAA